MGWLEPDKKPRKPLFWRNGDRVRSTDERDRLDNLIRGVVGDGGMYSGTLATIRYYNEFEGFGSYEDWGQGYVVELFDTQTKTRLGHGSSRYLDTAIEKAVADARAKKSDV